MKPAFKQIYLFLFLIAFCNSGISQISIGVKGHISTIGAPLVEKQDFFSKKLRPTFNPGISIFGEYKMNDILAIQAELAFRQNRSHYRLRYNVPTVHTSMVNYVRMPIMLKVSQNKKWINLIVFGGPNIGYAIGISAAETIEDISVNNATFSKLSFGEYQIRRFDFAFTLGVGIEKTIANKFRTTLDIRYDYGLTDIMKAPFNSYVNRGFAIEMGILIPVSRFKKSN